MNRLQQISSPAVPAVDDSVEAQFVHVPGGGAFIPHEIEGTSHVGVAVVTKQIVLGEKVQRALFITVHKMCMEFLTKADLEASFEPRLSILDFVSQLWSLGSRLFRSRLAIYSL